MKTIIEMAREASNTPIDHHATPDLFGINQIERFAELVRADERAIAAVKLEQRVKEAYQDGHSAGVKAEREACAQLCEDAEEYPQYFQTTSLPAAIRARGNT